MDTRILEIKGLISELPERQRSKVNECAEELRSVIKKYGDEAMIALALVGIENGG